MGDGEGKRRRCEWGGGEDGGGDGGASGRKCYERGMAYTQHEWDRYTQHEWDRDEVDAGHRVFQTVCSKTDSRMETAPKKKKKKSQAVHGNSKKGVGGRERGRVGGSCRQIRAVVKQEPLDDEAGAAEFRRAPSPPNSGERHRLALCSELS